MKSAVSIFLAIIVSISVVLPINSSAQATDNTTELASAYSSGDYQRALAIVEKWFEESHSIDHALMLAEFHLSGKGTPVDTEKAKMYFRMAAYPTNINSENGRFMVAYANRIYGALSLMDNDEDHIFTTQEFEPFLRAIEIGNDAYSMYLVGHSVLSGDYKEKSEEEAIELLKRSASNNCIAACVDLGGIYADEYGDSETALKYYIQAASTPLYTPSLGNMSMEYFINPNDVNNPLNVYYYNSACNNAANILTDNEEYEEALLWLDKITTKEAKYLRNKGYNYLQLGKAEEAIKEYEESLTLETDSKVHHLLGVLYYELDKDAEISKNHLKKAIELGNQAAAKSYREYFE